MTDDQRTKIARDAQSFWQKILASQLTRAGIPFSTNASVNGFYADFVVPSSSGRPIAIEAKVLAENALSRTLKNRLTETAIQGSVASGADVRWAVRGLPQGDTSPQLLSEANFLDVISQEWSSQPEPTAIQHTPPEIVADATTIFAAMPFDARYDDVYYKAMTRVAKHLKAAIKRVDMYPYDRDSVDEIKHQIENSALVIADLSEGSPSVLYEVGYADGIGRRVIHITSTPRSALPFNVRNWPTIKYVRGSVDSLTDELMDAARAAFTDLKLPVPTRRPPRLAPRR